MPGSEREVNTLIVEVLKSGWGFQRRDVGALANLIT